MTATRTTMVETNGKVYLFEQILVLTPSWVCGNGPSHDGYQSEGMAWAAMVRHAKQNAAGWPDGTVFGVHKGRNGKHFWYYRA